jgi:nicotinate-nucleotide adenylyltransferase
LARGIGILGGTFDPIHYGHLRMADEVRRALDLSEVRLVPAGNPYHRAAQVAGRAAPSPRLTRLAMVELAVAEFPGLAVDPREATTDAPSYTVDTLTAIRAEIGDAPLLLLLGADAFVTLPAWKAWQRLFELAHVVLIARPGFELPFPLPAGLAEAYAERLVRDPALLNAGTGRIYCQMVEPQPISATLIRRTIRDGRDPAGMLPSPVIHYIHRHHLYTDRQCA